MFQPIQISIPAEKYTEDVYIILEKLEGEVNTSENSRYYPEHRDKTYYASKALKETYIVTMPTQEHQTTVTCYGTNREVVTPFEGLYFRNIEEVTSKLDEINNRKVQAVFKEVCTRLIAYECNSGGRYSARRTIQDKIETADVSQSNFYEKIVEIFGEDFRSSRIIQPWHDFH